MTVSLFIKWYQSHLSYYLYGSSWLLPCVSGDTNYMYIRHNMISFLCITSDG